MDDHQNPPQDPPQSPLDAYQGSGSAAEGGNIYHADIDPKYQDMAVKSLWEALKGNGVEAEEIEVSQFKGETLEFLAVTVIKLRTKISDRRQAGKASGPQVMASAQAIKDSVEKEEHKITHSQDVIKRVKEVILSRQDKGFGLENEFIKMPFLHKSYVIYEPCSACRAQGKIQCGACAGKGRITCPRCNGSGSESCGPCGGRQYLQGPQGQKQQCMHCAGRGRIMCESCNQQRTVMCTKCRGAQLVSCTQCNAHAYISHIYMAEIDGFANFEYDEEKLPVRVVETLQSYGRNAPDHVEFKPVRIDKERGGDDIVIPYQIRAPHADIIFKIKGVETGAFMFGTQAQLKDMPYFLERTMKDGIKHLRRAGTGQGNIAHHLIKAGTYRTLRQIIITTTRMGPKKSYASVMKTTPLGLSDEMGKKLVIMADRALRQITRKPRYYGAGAGAGLSVAAAGAYFYAGRGAVLSSMHVQYLDYALDAALLGALCYLALACVKFSAANSMKKTLGALMKEGETQKLTSAKTGKPGRWALGGAIGAFVLAALSCAYTGAAPVPVWIRQLLTIAGLL